MRIGIVGSGIAGLSAAWLLTLRGHEVHLYEKQESLGLGAHSVDVGNFGDVIDVPIRAFHEGYYPEMLCLFRYVGIETKTASSSPSIQIYGQDSHFGMRNLLVGKYSIPFIRPWQLIKHFGLYFTIIKDVLRFKKACINMRDDKSLRASLSQISLAQYVIKHQYSKAFTDMLLIPLFAVITTSSAQNVREYPITVVMDYMDTLFWLSGHQTTRLMTPGARTAGDILSENVKVKHTGITIRSIEPNRNEKGELVSVAILADGLPVEHFDHVIVATQANQAARLLPSSRADHVEVLRSFKYVWSEMVVHSDERLMPLDRANWSPGNFFIQPNCPETKASDSSSNGNAYKGKDERNDDALSEKGLDIKCHSNGPFYEGVPDCSSGGALMCTVWQNMAQTLKMDEQPGGVGFPVFQTWNPWVQPRPEKVLPNGYHYFERPVVTIDTERALEELEAIQGQDNIWFIGAYALPGVPLLENAANSGLIVAEKLTDQQRPWREKSSYEPEMRTEVKQPVWLRRQRRFFFGLFALLVTLAVGLACLAVYTLFGLFYM